MTEPKETDKILGDIITQLEVLTQHINDISRRVSEALNVVVELQNEMINYETRLSIVEGRTQGLSQRPIQKNCIHCGRRLTGTGNRCGVCGKEQ